MDVGWGRKITNEAQGWFSCHGGHFEGLTVFSLKDLCGGRSGECGDAREAERQAADMEGKPTKSWSMTMLRVRMRARMRATEK